MANHKEFEKSQAERDTYESIGELMQPKEFYADSPFVNILHDLSEKEKNDPRVHARFKRSRKSDHLFSITVKITTNYRKELSEPLGISIIYSNQRAPEMLKTSIKTKYPWI